MMEYRVVNVNGKYNPQRYDKYLGWVSYRNYAEDLLFDTEQEALNHIDNNPSSLNVSCD